MNTDRLDLLLSRFPALTILVVGDFFLDKYLVIEAERAETSLETGLPAHQVVEVRCQPGAAGTVTNNLRAMGVKVIALGIVGDDGEGFELLRGLDATGVDLNEIVIRADRLTPTYTKPLLRDASGITRELNRLDIRSRTSTPAAAEDALIRSLRGLLPRVHGVVIADQMPEEDCGVVTERVRAELPGLARLYPDVAFIADSRARIGLFEDVMLKPNAREATLAVQPDFVGEPDRPTAEAAAAMLYRRIGQPVFLTLGAGGILALHQEGPTHIPAVPVTGPIDIVGAGDATMAGIAAALCAGATVPEAAEVGVLAAAVTIRQIGTTGTASAAQIRACLHEYLRTP